ncbi:MAG: DnaJ domain-containing protein [Cyclobacteriaceae bacterium]
MYNAYSILGVANFSSVEEVKSVYKKLAKELHPDKNPGNKVAEEQFKNINAAYTLLSNSLKKKIHDDKLHYAIANPNHRSRTNTYTRSNSATHQPRYYRKANEPQRTKKSETKLYVITSLIGVVFIALLLTFAHYMNLHLARKYYRIAKVHAARYEYDHAFLNLHLASKYEVMETEIEELKGDLNVILGKNVEASNHFAEAIYWSEETEKERLFFKKGKAEVKAKQFGNAISSFSNLNSKSSFQDSASFFLGSAYLGRNNIPLACQYYKKAIPFFPEERVELERLINHLCE